MNIAITPRTTGYVKTVCSPSKPNSRISPSFLNINLELSYDDKDKKGLEDEWYANIEFVYPPRSGPSLQDGFINPTAWKDQKDMSGELLTKVERNNKIMIEFKGSSTISRAD